jgi:hypothetical protein
MFRFSIRELMLVTLVVALALGWWVDRSQIMSELRQERQKGFTDAPSEESALERYSCLKPTIRLQHR